MKRAGKICMIMFLILVMTGGYVRAAGPEADGVFTNVNSSVELIIDTPLGKLGADAAVYCSGADAAIVVSRHLKEELGAGVLDMEKLSASFDNSEKYVTVDISADLVFDIFEESFSHIVLNTDNTKINVQESAYDGYLSFSGLTVSCEPGQPAFSRVGQIFVGDEELLRGSDQTVTVCLPETLYDSIASKESDDDSGQAVDDSGAALAEMVYTYACEKEFLEPDNLDRLAFIGITGDSMLESNPLLSAVVILIVMGICYFMKQRMNKG